MNELYNTYDAMIMPASGKIAPKIDNVNEKISEKVKGVETYVDDNDFVVELPALSTLKQITVNCKGKDIEIDGARLINDDIKSILNDLPIRTKIKNVIGGVLLSDTPLKQKRIEVRKLKKLGINQKYINLFLKLLEYLTEV